MTEFLCLCGCGSRRNPRRKFLPGHDSKFVATLAASVTLKEITRRKALTTAGQVSEKLAEKLERELDRRAAAAKPKPTRVIR